MTPEQAALALVTAAVHADARSLHDLAEEVADWDHARVGRLIGAISGLAAGVVRYHLERHGDGVLQEMGLVAARWEDDPS